MWKSVLYLSVFDHWLTENEADHCAVLCYQLAVSKGALNQYLKGEQNFLSFYRTFSHLSIFNHGINIAPTSTDFDKILISSLREQKFMDLYIPELQLRFQGGFDRTDLLFIADEQWLPQIKQCAAQNGLNIIDQIEYSKYYEAMQEFL